MIDYYTLEQLASSRLHEARDLAHKERLAASLRPARPPRPFRLGRALRQLGRWLLGGAPHAVGQHSSRCGTSLSDMVAQHLWAEKIGSALHGMLFLEHPLRPLLIGNGFQSLYDQ